MREAIKELINKWDEFRDDRKTSMFSEDDLAYYSKLLVESFPYLKEWKNDKVDKDVALLYATIGYFSSNTMDSSGNIHGSEAFERAVVFNMLFTNELFYRDYFDTDEQGMLLFDRGYFGVLKIDPSKFEIPVVDDMF